MTFRLSDGLPDAVELQVRGVLARADHEFANTLALVAAVIASHSRRLPETETIPVRDVRLLLAKLSARIDAVARLHRLLSIRGAGDAMEVRAYLGQIIAAVKEAFDESDTELISTNLQCESELSAKAAGAVGLFVLEAVINSIKFAGGTSVVVSLRRGAPAQLVVEVIDGGPGLPVGLNTEGDHGPGLGLRHLHNIARQLNGELSFDPLTPGLSVRLVWPTK